MNRFVKSPRAVFIPEKPVKPEFVCGENFLFETKSEIQNRLDEMDNVHGEVRVPPMAVVRCSRGGKTRALYEIAYIYYDDTTRTNAARCQRVKR